MSSISVRPWQGGAVSRTSAMIIMMIDAALGQLRDMGYERGFDDVEVVNVDGFPFITLNGEVVFEVVLNVDEDKGISIDGEWRFHPPRRRALWLIRSVRWLKRKLGYARTP